MKFILLTLSISALMLHLSACEPGKLAISSFGPLHEKSSKASPADVVSMGRDDDDGKAKKWHIGGVLK